MNSLVVLFSVLALAAAKPSVGLEGGLLAYAAPAAIVAAPAAVSHQSRIDVKSSPALIAAPFAAPIAHAIAQPALVAPTYYAAAAPAAAVTHQSRFDYTSSPTVIATAPVAYAAPISYAAPAILAHGAIAPAVPLDTPEVVAARAAHFEAKALAAHSIHKRSVATYVASSPLLGHGYSAYSAPIATYPSYSPITYSYSTPLINRAYGVHPW